MIILAYCVINSLTAQYNLAEGFIKSASTMFNEVGTNVNKLIFSNTTKQINIINLFINKQY